MQWVMAFYASIPYGHRAPVRISAAVLPIQFLLMCLGQKWNTAPSAWPPAPRWEAHGEAPGLWPQPDPALATADVWRTKQWTAELSLCLPPSLTLSKKKRLSHSLSQWQGLASQSQESGARSFPQVSPTDAGATSTFPGTLAGSWIRRGAARLTASSVTSYTQHPHPKPHLNCCTKQSIGRTDGSWT